MERGAGAIGELCERLGRPEVWVEEDGYEHAIVGGAVEGERVAWVERRSRSDGGWVDVDYFLRARVGGAQVLEWVVDTYNPYFGCEVEFMRWWGEQQIVLVYEEKHRTIAACVELGGRVALRAIGHAWRRVGEWLLFPGEARGLIECVRVPDLAMGAPLPEALAETRAAGPAGVGEAGEIQRAITAWVVAGGRVERALAGLLVGALAYRFWEVPPPVVARYEELASRRWNPPCWLPFYLHATSPAGEAGALVATLEAIAARPAETTETLVGLACRHVADRCRELAAACRAGRLPEETSCYFWVEWSQEAIAGSRALFPAEFWAAVAALRPQAARLRALGEGA